MNDNQTMLTTVRAGANELEQLVRLHAKPGVDARVVVLQQLNYLEGIAMTKPDILNCTPQSVLLAMKMLLNNNLSLDPYAGLVYVKTRNVKISNNQWAKVLELQPSCEGIISMARQYGRILDIKRPEVKKNDAGRVTGVSVEILLPSTPEPRWETRTFDEDDIYRWQRASHTDNSRTWKEESGKPQPDAEAMNYASAHYTSFKGGIDPEFARAKAIRHALKKLGTNQNEVRMEKVTFAPMKTVIVDPVCDEVAATEEHGHAEVVTEAGGEKHSAKEPAKQPASYNPADL